MNLRTMKRLAAEYDVQWTDIEARAAEIHAVAVQSNAREYEIRRAAYQSVCPPAKRHMPYWKSFGQWNNPRYRGAFGGGNDWTVIPNWDSVAEELAGMFPELWNDNRPAETLYQLIIAPVSQTPTLREALAMAFDELVSPVMSAPCPF